MCTSNRDDRKLENTVKQSRFKHLGELHKEWTEAGVIFRKRATKPLLNQNIVRSILPGLRRKRTGLLLSAPKSSFQMKVRLVFNLEISVPESGGREETQNPCCLKSSVKFPQSVMVWAAVSSAGVGPLCFLKSTVNTAIYQDILEHFMILSADKLYGDADFIFQQDLAPAHTAKGTKSWFSDHGVTVLDWPANSPDLNPKESMMRDTRPNNAEELKAAIKAPWASLHLSSATGWSTPCHAALMQSFMRKETEPSIECTEMNILSRSLTFLFKIFFYWSYVIF